MPVNQVAPGPAAALTATAIPRPRPAGGRGPSARTAAGPAAATWAGNWRQAGSWSRAGIWAQTGPALRRLARLRVTPIYAATVITIWATTFAWAPALRERLVHHNSTNVANLLHGRVYTLLTSAFLLGSRREVLAVAALVVVLGAAELAWGWVRVAGVFLFGHVMATLLVFSGLLIGMSLHWWGGGRTAHAADVGVSYGAVAVVGALLVSLPLRRAGRWQLLAVAGAATAVAADQTFTDVGHLIALLLGFGAGALLRRTARLKAHRAAVAPAARAITRRPAGRSVTATAADASSADSSPHRR